MVTDPHEGWMGAAVRVARQPAGVVQFFPSSQPTLFTPHSAMLIRKKLLLPQHIILLSCFNSLSFPDSCQLRLLSLQQVIHADHEVHSFMGGVQESVQKGNNICTNDYRGKGPRQSAQETAPSETAGRKL